MDIEGMLSSLSFDDESGASQSSFECPTMLQSPKNSHLNYSTSCHSQSSSLNSSLAKHVLHSNNNNCLVKQTLSSQSNTSYSDHLIRNMLSQPTTSQQSYGSDLRFIPSRKHSKYTVMLSSAHEVKTSKSTKGQFVQNENDYSVAQLYMKHVLNLQTDETGAASKKKLAFYDQRVKNAYTNEGKNQNGPENSCSLLTNQRESIQRGSQGCLEDMLLSMRAESSLLQNDFESYGGRQRGIANGDTSACAQGSGGSADFSCMKRKNKMQAYTQYKVLDAPGLIDDFYLNLLDWSSKNLMAVGLGSQVYVWNGFNNRVSKVCEMASNSDQAGGENKVQAIQWSQSGNLLGVGDANGALSIYDVNTSKLVQQVQLHSDRIGSLSWKDDFLVASGSRDKSILCTDIRVHTPNAYRCIQRYTGHKQEVCGLKWSFDSQMLASGGNDNKLFVWSLRTSNHIHKFAEHKAGVKAIAWSPHQHGLLVSGGGTADRTIRFWNASIGKQVECIEVNSQVCNLVFSKNENEFVSTHGFQDNDIIVWKYPSLEKVACLTGHTCRVLQLGLSPCSTKIVTGAGDETLRFWDVFKQNPNLPQANTSSVLDSKFDLR